MVLILYFIHLYTFNNVSLSYHIYTLGTFGATSGFGTTSTGGTTFKFNPVTGTDTMVKNGVNQTINTRHQSITVMKEYENKIFEELRYEDYSANRKVGQQVIMKLK